MNNKFLSTLILFFPLFIFSQKTVTISGYIDESETGEPESPEETTGSDATPEQDETPQAKESPAGALPTTTAEKIAWCRQNDAQ